MEIFLFILLFTQENQKLISNHILDRNYAHTFNKLKYRLKKLEK